MRTARRDPVLPDDQEPVQSGAAPGDGHGAKPAQAAGLEWKVPDFSTVSRRQKHLAVTIGAQPTTTGLHLLVDSTGIKMLGEGEWKTKKHGAD